MKKKVTKKAVAKTKVKYPSLREVMKAAKPITPADIAQNCKDCPKPRKAEKLSCLGPVVALLSLLAILYVFAAFSLAKTDAALEKESCVRRGMYESGLPYTQENWEAFAANC